MTERPSKNLAAKQDWDKLKGEPSMETVNKIAAKHQVTGILSLSPYFTQTTNTRRKMAVPRDQGQHRQSLAEAGHRHVQWGIGSHSLHGQGDYADKCLYLRFLSGSG